MGHNLTGTEATASKFEKRTGLTPGSEVSFLNLKDFQLAVVGIKRWTARWPLQNAFF